MLISIFAGHRLEDRLKKVTYFITATNPWLASQLASGVKWNVRMNIQVCSPKPVLHSQILVTKIVFGR